MIVDILDIKRNSTTDLTKQIEDNDHKRYTLSVVSGQESVVVDNLRERVKKYNLGADITDFMVPVIPEVHMKKDSKTKKKIKVVREKKLFPGYIFVCTKMNDKIRYVIRNTPGVRLIVWSDIHPIPLSDTEYDEIKQKISKNIEEMDTVIAFHIDDVVTIIEGEFAGIAGKVTDIDFEKGMLDIRVEMLWRNIPVTIGFEKVELV